MKIITVSRQFGSGGREFAKHLADQLGYAYYDSQIIRAIADRLQLDENYVAQNVEDVSMPTVPLTFGRTLFMQAEAAQGPQLIGVQDQVIRELAEKGPCVIVGRAADVILAEYQPLRIIVYADMAARVARCQAQSRSEEKLSDREMEKEIARIDKRRARTYEFVAPGTWGDKDNADLCLNTTHADIPMLAEWVAGYAKAWFERKHA